MNGGKLAAKALLRSIYSTDADFSEAFKKIDAEIENETDVKSRRVLEELKDMGCAWVDYKHVFGYDDELMLATYNAIRAEGSKCKDAINQAVQMSNSHGGNK